MQAITRPNGGTGAGSSHDPDSAPQIGRELRTSRAVIFYTLRMSLLAVAAAVFLDAVTNLSAPPMEILQSVIKTTLIAGVISPVVIHRIGRYNHRLYLANDQLRTANRFDAQTGLLNRATFIQDAGARLPDASMLLLIDIDHFKRVNDRYGHPAGDAVIAQVGVVIAECFPPPSLCGRLGGEEFGVLAVGEGHRTASALRHLGGRVTACRFDAIDPALRVTISIGAVATARSAEHDFGTLYAEADLRLYQAKREGRNRLQAGILAA